MTTIVLFLNIYPTEREKAMKKHISNDAQIVCRIPTTLLIQAQEYSILQHTSLSTIVRQALSLLIKSVASNNQMKAA
jgi:hypothetical protein